MAVKAHERFVRGFVVLRERRAWEVRGFVVFLGEASERPLLKTTKPQ